DPAALRHAWERCGARPAPGGFVLSGQRADALAAEASPAERAEVALLAWALGRPERAIPLWLEAGAFTDARAHAEEAARLLVVEGAHGEAERVLVAVLESTDLPEADARRLRRVLVALLEDAGELARAAAQATALVEAGDDDARPVLARLRIATGEPLRAEAALEGAPATLEVGALRAELAYQRGALAEAETHAHALAAKAQAEGEAEAELTALQTHAKSQLDDMAEARRRFDRYAARARALGSARHEALALGGRGVAAIRARALDDAERDLRRAAALAEEADDPKGRALAWHNLAVVAHLRHRWGDAREAYEEALRWLRLLGHRASLARCAYNLGELYERLGALDRARAVARLGTEVGGGATLPPAAQAEGWVLRGRVELQARDAPAAEAAFEEAAEHLGVLDPSRRAAVALGRARAAMALGALDDAEALLGALPAELPDAQQAEAALARAELVRLRHGRLGRELPHAERALKAAERAGDPHLELEALVVLADALGAGGGAAAAEALWARARSLDAELAATVPDDLREAFAARPLRRRLERGRALGPAPRFGGIVGGSPALLDALEVAERVAPTTCTVLLRGESGTGKELVAEAIHRASPRRRGPLVRVNCAALVDTLLASELFGHEKGAFTGATSRRRGRFELAEGGTLFLDEIGDISPKMQAALLRVLQEKRIERVGGTESIDVDVRVIAATHRDLEELVAEGVFREDLYYRLDEVSVRLPPLREREGDVPLLARHLLARIAEERGEPIRRLTPEAVAKLEAHAWPGNVRQLENALKAASLFAASGAIEPGDLTLPAGPSATPSGEPDDYARLRAGELTMKELKKELERRCIAQALEESAGNVTKAAELIGMTRPRLSQLAKAYGLRGDEKTGSQGGEA
ncbi:MAG: hypothetical protein CMH59_14975, partial [Myxococcales bacterium]|nr:hypothetical protein [Myxococcales bacterium]